MKYRIIAGILITIALIVAYVLLAPRQSADMDNGGAPTEVVQ